MPSLFEKTTINGLTLDNRFVRSATWEGMAAEDGTCTPRLVGVMRELAEGRVGLIIASHAYVAREGQATPWQLGIYDDSLIDGLGRMVEAVHDCQGKIVAQLAHAGCFGSERLSGMPPLALTLYDARSTQKCRLATTEDLDKIPTAFADAARRAQQAGFDGVQIHAAHGYLLSQSLSPAFNQREDGYGGGLTQRARLVLEVLAAVRQAVGSHFPVLVKINCADFIENGLTVEDAVQVACMLQNSGIDAVEVSGGTVVSGALSPVREKITSEDKEAYFRASAVRFKNALDVPILLVGGIRSRQTAETLLKEGVADYFSLARPLICEPHLIKRWQEGDARKSACVSDNLCNKAARAGEGIYCVVDKRRQATQR
jgi:2,4-dienoyl-CoA reductase-like NADH-dependent reductase (Old Yellow Enzyme family)